MRLPVFLLMLSISFIPAMVIAENEPYGALGVLPTPKMMKIVEKRFVLNDNKKPVAFIVMDNDDRRTAIAAQEINDRITSLGGQPLPTVRGIDSAAGLFSGMNTISLMVPGEDRSRDISREIREAMDSVSAKGEQGYAIRFFKGQGKNEAALLAGVGWQGLMHAGSTFRLLIKKEGSTIFATEAQVTDWPDFKFRGLPVWPLPGSFDDFKKYVDWALRYKFNRIYTYTTRKKAPDGFNLPTPEERRYLKQINAYARERGIKINYALTWAVASTSPGGNRDKLQGNVLFNAQYYSWSDDGLLRKRALEIAQFAKETEAESLHFHCIDNYEEGWDERGKNDRARFGNDRAMADANVINIFTREIRRINPGIELQFVVSPYHANIDLAGNERYKTWMTQLTGLIPHDIYLTVAELNRDQTDSWVAAVTQPLVHWINGNAFQWGRYFSTLPAFTKSAYDEGREKDIIIYWEPIGYFNGEVMQLISSEYEWNVDALGNGYVIEEKTGKINITGGRLHSRKEMVNGTDVNSWAWFDGTEEPKPTAGGLLLEACRLEFGEAAAPYMAEFFRNNPVGWRSAALYGQVLRDSMAGKELDASRDQLRKAENALASLKQALDAAKMDSPVREKLKSFLSNTYRQVLLISATNTYSQANQLLMKGLNAEASEIIKNGRNRLAEIRREMEKQGYWSNEALEWLEEGNGKLKTAEDGLKKDHSMNLVKNAGFEERLDPGGHSRDSIPRWSSLGPLEIIQDSHSGRYAVSLTLKPADDFVFMEQAFDVAPGCNGYIEFWLKKDGDFRVIPTLQYWNADHTRGIEDLASKDFPFNTEEQDYRVYIGSFRMPPHVTRAVFKIYADWFGFTPTHDKALCIDDVFVSCISSVEKGYQ
jgi:hypothetical protein